SSDNSQTFGVTGIHSALNSLILELRHLPQNERPAIGTSFEHFTGDALKILRFVEQGGHHLNYRECSNLIQALQNFLSHQGWREEHPFHVAISQNDQATLELTVNRVAYRDLEVSAGSWYIEGPVYPTRRLQSAAGHALFRQARNWASSHDPHSLIPREVYLVFRAQGKYLDLDFGPQVREGTSRISYEQFIVVLDGLGRHFDGVGWNVFSADILTRGYHEYVVAVIGISESAYGGVLQPTGDSGIKNETVAATSALWILAALGYCNGKASGAMTPDSATGSMISVQDVSVEGRMLTEPAPLRRFGLTGIMQVEWPNVKYSSLRGCRLNFAVTRDARHSWVHNIRHKALHFRRRSQRFQAERGRFPIRGSFAVAAFQVSFSRFIETNSGGSRSLSRPQLHNYANRFTTYVMFKLVRHQLHAQSKGLYDLGGLQHIVHILVLLLREDEKLLAVSTDCSIESDRVYKGFQYPIPWFEEAVAG
ncbi:MAG: hypothetical protein Q9214_001456, partial [Letrouitia sp. 1 TL-2023]